MPFKITIAVLLFIVLTPPSFALSIPPQPDGYVTDQVGILSPQTKAELENSLRNFENETSDQIVVAIFQNLEGESLEDFSIRLAEKWKIGQKGKDNGVILLIFTENHKLRIEVGYGLEGVLPDILAEQIIRNKITPSFRQGDFNTGVLQGIEAIKQSIVGEFKGEPVSPDQQPFQVSFIFYALLFLFCIDGIRYTRYHLRFKNYVQRYRPLEWWFRFALLFFLLKILFDLFYFIALSSHGNSYGNRSGFGGGGFRGGGGGSFGGGGANGGW